MFTRGVGVGELRENIVNSIVIRFHGDRWILELVE